jgi:peroxiredoxin
LIAAETPAAAATPTGAEPPAHALAGAPVAGHSLHGEAFNEGPRAAAVLMEGMPKVHFPITSTNTAVQAYFDQGVGQLHGFWYFEAERSFRQAARLDPNCPMAFWGMAMANINNASRAREFLVLASALKSSASPREQRWIDALADYRREKDGDKDRPDKDRRRDYVRALESLVQDFPDDIEARAFLVFQIWDNAGFGNERPLAIPSQQAVDALLDQVFAKAPLHPAHHYRIHLWDNEKPVRALGSAAQCGPSGPGIAHLWHMPGHTYDKFQRYADAAWQQEASARVDHAHMRRARILPDQIHNYAHNQEWLSRSLSHLGRVSDSLAIARNLTELPRHPKWNSPDKPGTSAAYGRWRLAATLLRWELWDQALAETDPSTGHLEPVENREHTTLRLFTRAFAQLMREGTNSLPDSLAALESLRAEISRDRVKAADDAEARARKENKPREDVGRAMAEALQGFDKDVLPVDEAIAELRGWQAALGGETNTLKEQFDLVKRAPKTRLAYAWLRAGNPDKAIQLATEATAKSTNQLHELATRCDILWQAGRTNEAGEAFNAVRAAAAQAEPDLPVLRRLRPVADALGLAGDWRPTPVTPSDLGPRPPLETLGPRTWEPYDAPAWSFAAGDGTVVDSTAFAGRPHLLIYYLGHGCAHCIEQLKAFGPMADDFKAAGVEILAISLDDPADLPWTTRRAGTDGQMKFQVLSDTSRSGFKAYRAYDDFEDVPLHGTFLVDAAGKVRWQDISHQPFTEAKVLLTECKRLLRPTRSLAHSAANR